MARLIQGLGCALLLWATPARADPVERWRPHIAEASARFGIPEDWIRRVMRAESGGHLTKAGRPIVSRSGAMGLMQLMPGTWRDMRDELRLGPNPHDPRDNILAGTAYLRAMYDRFGYPGLFAAYNGGPARVEAHLLEGTPLPTETRSYVRRLTTGDHHPIGAPVSTGAFGRRNQLRHPENPPGRQAERKMFIELSDQPSEE